MKFGGTSVADADKIRNAAGRIADAKRRGEDVVAVVSARGATTDELEGLAHEVSSRPDPREMDMLLSTGERISCALMAMARFCLKTLPEIERPAIAAIWPTVERECIVLDVGANVGADAKQLVDFAMMGADMARALFSLERPSVGLLNIGVEEIKGLDQIRNAGAALRETMGPDVPLRSS